ncbi:MAG: Ribonuclease J 1 [Firmicutes bacterium ADurb.Bin193]|nr:MAG: Ribonuclease J 1 [Firmicutes bacterium ADurb.Bin193]
MFKKQKLKIIPLGGLDEIGKNLTVFEYGDDIMVVDCGLAFPDDEMLGVDLVIPDITYLVKNMAKVRGIVITHGHEDHIGALPYVLRELDCPVYGTRFTLGLVAGKLKEHGLASKAKLKPVSHGDTIRLGEFKVEFIRSNHSIPDVSCLAIFTPVGTVFHTGDFKIDPTPIDGSMIDLARIGEIGKQGVLVLMSDSTNAERPGYTMSESNVSIAFEEIFRANSHQRIIVATFASNVHRVQQIINCAHTYGRKVAVSGRSMLNIISIAIELGYMKVPKGLMIDIDETTKYPPEKLVIITTGSQGETMSALTRMAFSDHKKISLGAGDTVLISATPIPGNEKSVFRVINELFKLGCEVIYESLAEIHVSGHACKEELKVIMGLVKPKYFVPAHGEYRHLMRHASIAGRMGVNKKNVFIMSNGQVLEVNEDGAKINGSVPAGKVLVDGLGVGDVGNIVLRDRKHLAEDGIILVVVAISSDSREITSGPDVISRGFVYMRESEDLIEEIKSCTKRTLEDCRQKNMKDWNTLKANVKNDLSEFLYEKTKRKPMILPVIMEV